MIYIDKLPDPPKILVIKQKEFNDALKRYGGFEKIPDEDCKNILKAYKHKEVKQLLIECSHNKCAYCESKSTGNYLEVEHFAPKKLYPKLTLIWDNLLPSCKVCNLHKYLHDTINDPIINPCKEDPEPYFVYSFLKIYPSEKAPNINLAKKTIDVCGLNRSNLIEERLKVLKALSDWETEIEKKIDKLEKSREIEENHGIFLDLSENLGNIEKTGENQELYAGLCRYFLKKSHAYKRAKDFTLFYQNYLDELSR